MRKRKNNQTHLIGVKYYIVILIWKWDILERKELIDLIEQIKKFEGTEEEEEVLLERLQNMVLDPEVSDYIYWTDMSSEEIADKVLAYKPIILKNK